MSEEITLREAILNYLEQKGEIGASQKEIWENIYYLVHRSETNSHLIEEIEILVEEELIVPIETTKKFRSAFI